MNKNNRYEFRLNVFKSGNTPVTNTLKLMLPENEVSITTVDRARLHRWLDALIDDEKISNIDIHKYNIKTGYIPEHQQVLLKREEELDKLEEIYNNTVYYK